MTAASTTTIQASRPRLALGIRVPEPLAAASLLLLAVVVVYSQIVFLERSQISANIHSRAVATRDQSLPGTPANTFNIDLGTAAAYEAPVNALVGALLRSGQAPLWDPYSAAGIPLAAQYSTRALFPYQMLQDLTPPTSWDWFLLGRYWIAALLTFCCLRYAVKLAFGPAVVGGMLYAFTGVFVWYATLEEVSNPAMVYPGAFMAWGLLGQRPSLRRVALASLFTGLVLLGGQPEVAFYMLVTCGLFWLFEAVRSVGVKRLHYAILWPALVSALGLMLAAPLVLPFIEFVSNAFNTHPPGGHLGTQTPITPDMRPSVVIPTFHRVLSQERIGAHNGVWDFVGGYTGAVAFLFVIVAVVRNTDRRPYGWFFGGMGGFLLLKILGVPGFIHLGLLPVFDQVWSNRWGAPAWMLPICCAAAVGLHSLLTPVESARPRRGAFVSFPQRLTTLLARLRLRFVPFAARYRYRTGLVSLAAGVLLAPGWVTFGLIAPWQLLPASNATATLQGLLTGLGAACLLLPRGEVTSTARALAAAVVLVHVLVQAATVAWSAVPPLGGLNDPLIPSVVLGEVTVLVALHLAAWTAMRIDGLTPEARRRALWFLGLLAFIELWVYVPRALDVTSDSLMFVVAAAALLPLFAVRRWPQAGALGVGLVLLGGGLAVDANATHRFAERVDPYAPRPYIEYLKQNLGDQRIMHIDGQLHPNVHAAAGIRSLGFITSLSVREWQGFMESNLTTMRAWPTDRLWFTGVRDPHLEGPESAFTEVTDHREAYSFLGVKFLLAPGPGPLPDAMEASPVALSPFPLIYEDEDARIFVNPDVLPRTFLVRDTRTVARASEAWAAFRSIDASHTAFVEGVAPDWYRAAPPDNVPMAPAERTAVTRDEALRVDVDVTASQPALLVLTDTHYVGWRAYLDGVEVPITRVNGVVRGVYVPGGDHTVSFQYAPASFRVGMIAATMALATIGCFAIFPTRLLHRRRPIEVGK